MYQLVLVPWKKLFLAKIISGQRSALIMCNCIVREMFNHLP